MTTERQIGAVELRVGESVILRKPLRNQSKNRNPRYLLADLIALRRSIRLTIDTGVSGSCLFVSIFSYITIPDPTQPPQIL